MKVSKNQFVKGKHFDAQSNQISFDIRMSFRQTIPLSRNLYTAFYPPPRRLRHSRPGRTTHSLQHVVHGLLWIQNHELNMDLDGTWVQNHDGTWIQFHAGTCIQNDDGTWIQFHDGTWIKFHAGPCKESDEGT